VEAGKGNVPTRTNTYPPVPFVGPSLRDLAFRAVLYPLSTTAIVSWITVQLCPSVILQSRRSTGIDSPEPEIWAARYWSPGVGLIWSKPSGSVAVAGASQANTYRSNNHILPIEVFAS
jgi:hypothetical protein